MSSIYPSHGIRRKFNTATSSADTALSSTITVPAGQFGIVWKLWVSLANVATDAQIEALPSTLTISVTMGSTVWSVEVHPFIQRAADSTSDIDQLDLGPWEFDFGVDGLYSAEGGDDIVVAVDAAGGVNTTKVDYIYSGD